MCNSIQKICCISIMCSLKNPIDIREKSAKAADLSGARLLFNVDVGIPLLVQQTVSGKRGPGMFNFNTIVLYSLEISHH